MKKELTIHCYRDGSSTPLSGIYRNNVTRFECVIRSDRGTETLDTTIKQPHRNIIEHIANVVSEDYVNAAPEMRKKSGDFTKRSNAVADKIEDATTLALVRLYLSGENLFNFCKLIPGKEDYDYGLTPILQRVAENHSKFADAVDLADAMIAEVNNQRHLDEADKHTHAARVLAESRGARKLG